MSNENTSPELVVVADADAEELLKSLMRRAIESGCLREFNWIVRRDPMRDAAVCRHPLKAVVDIDRMTTKILVVFDYDGCGREGDPAGTIERDVETDLVRGGFKTGQVRCIVLRPELEAVLIPAWARMSELLALKRKLTPPEPRDILVKAGILAPHQGTTPQAWQERLSEHPKECLDGMLRILRLRHQPALFAEFGKALSLPSLKQGDAASRQAGTLVEWFGGRQDLTL